jgi:tetratricopeptide (TPR) repeat protein
MRIVLGMALVALTLQAAAGSVCAQPAPVAQMQTQLGPPDESARPMFEMGRRAFEAGRYAEALDAFQRVFVLTGHPAMLVNIANSHARLGKPRRAAASLEQYLALVPDAPDRLVLEARISALYDQQDTVPLVEAPASATPQPGAEPPPPPAASDTVPSAPAEPQHGLLLGRTYTWLALGTSLLLAGVGTAVWIDANQRFERLALTCGSNGGCTDRQVRPVSNGVSATNVLLVGSIVALAATGFLFAIEAPGAAAESPPPVSPALDIHPHGVALGVVGRL